MSRTRTLTDLIADVRSRTNMETSTFVTDAEITEFLNQELAELWGHITQSSGAPHYRSLRTYAVTVGTALYALPADFWQVQGVEATIAGETYALRSFASRERAALVNSNSQRYPYRADMMYRVQAGNIEFQPVSQAFSAALFYTPSCPRLVDGSDTFDGYNGWEVAAIYGACAIVQEKEGTEFQFYEGRKSGIYRQIDAQAAQRDAAEPERVVDVMGNMTSDDCFGRGWL